MSELLTWDELKLEYIGESLDRNVKWYLEKYPWLESDDCRVNKIRNQGEGGEEGILMILTVLFIFFFFFKLF